MPAIIGKTIALELCTCATEPAMRNALDYGMAIACNCGYHTELNQILAQTRSHLQCMLDRGDSGVPDFRLRMAIRVVEETHELNSGPAD
jgi:hypothetical protein